MQDRSANAGWLGLNPDVDDDRSDGVARCWQVECDRGRRPHLAYLGKPNLLSVLTRGRLSFGPIRTQEGQSIGRRKQGGDEERG